PSLPRRGSQRLAHATPVSDGNRVAPTRPDTDFRTVDTALAIRDPRRSRAARDRGWKSIPAARGGGIGLRERPRLVQCGPKRDPDWRDASRDRSSTREQAQRRTDNW